MVDVVGSGEGTGGYTSFSAVSAPATGLSTGGPAASSRLSGAPQLAGGPVGDKSLPRRQGVHGYMNKYTGEGSFQRRYFELRGNCLLYFVDARATDPKGVILLDGAKVQQHARIFEPSIFGFSQNADLSTDHSMVLWRPSGRAFQFCGDKASIVDEWIRNFKATGEVTILKPATPTTGTDGASTAAGVISAPSSAPSEDKKKKKKKGKKHRKKHRKDEPSGESEAAAPASGPGPAPSTSPVIVSRTSSSTGYAAPYSAENTAAAVPRVSAPPQREANRSAAVSPVPVAASAAPAVVSARAGRINTAASAQPHPSPVASSVPAVSATKVSASSARPVPVPVRGGDGRGSGAGVPITRVASSSVVVAPAISPVHAGAAPSAVTVVGKMCPGCSASLRPKAKFCSKCGNRVP